MRLGRSSAFNGCAGDITLRKMSQIIEIGTLNQRNNEATDIGGTCHGVLA
jgi:hypothetical protein